MSTIHISCPHCSFTREVPADKVPDEPVQVTCPKCKQPFDFDKISAARRNRQTMVAPPPLPDTPPPLPEPPPQPEPQPALDTARPVVTSPIRRELMGVGELFSSTWELFKQRWLLLLGIILATVLALMVPPVLAALALAGSAKGSFIGMVAFIMGMGIAFILSTLIAFWGMAALLNAAVHQQIGFSESFERAKRNWIALGWASTLYSFIVGGASLLFIIPGILTGIWFFSCGYLVVAEDTRGMNSLLKSKALVSGRFLPVFGRLLLTWLLSVVLGMIPVIGPVLSILFAPFSVLYSVRLYQDLSDTAGPVSWSSTDGTKAGWLLLGLAGYLVIPLLIFLMLGAAFMDSVAPLFRMMFEQGKLQHMSGLYELMVGFLH